MTMRTIPTITVTVALFLFGCGNRTGGGDDDGGDDTGPLPEPAWSIDVDLSGLDRFVPLGTTTWTVGGTATASEGLASVEVGGGAATVDGAGAFSSDVSAAPGLTVVPVVARDAKGNQRQAHRSLISARWLPEGAANPDGAGMILTDEILATMGEGLAGEAADVDVAAEIMARDVLSQDDRCVTWPVYAEQGAVAVELVQDDGALWLNIQIPDLYVYFEGECQGLLSTIPIAGEMAGTIDLWTQLDPIAPAGEEACLSSFDHTTPEVLVNGWYFDVWGTSGPLQNWIVTLFSGSKSEEARQQIATEVQTRGDELLTEKLADIVVFDRTSSLELLGRPIDMHLCLSALETAGGQLVARVAATAQGGGTKTAPGAPQLDGAAPAPAAGELVLDGNLVAQLLFSAWRDGGLTRANVQQVELSLIGLLVPELGERFPDAEVVDVSIDGELPPLVRATSEAGGDLHVEIGDLMLDLAIEGTPIFRFAVRLTLDLELVPDGGALVPTVIGSEAAVVLIDEALDGPDGALEEAVALKIGDAASELLAGAALALPELPGLGAPADVTPDAGGRFLHIRLE
jgi:hypothetical protein